jgi:hypothetical protein
LAPFFIYISFISVLFAISDLFRVSLPKEENEAGSRGGGSGGVDAIYCDGWRVPSDNGKCEAATISVISKRESTILCKIQ